MSNINMKYIIGTKIGMTRLTDVNGKIIPVTIVSCEPNVVLSKKNNITTIGYDTTSESKVNKPHAGVFKKNNLHVKKVIRSFNISDNLMVGEEIKVTDFKKGQYVDVQAYNKGHGFTGAIKRWNFKIGPLAHGAGYPHRFQGSIAMGRGGSQAQRVAKGKKMHGHWGHELTTIQNLTIVSFDADKHLLLISGAIPGPKGAIVVVKTSVKKPNEKIEYNIINREKAKKIIEENAKLENKEELYNQNNIAEIKEEINEMVKDAENEMNAAEQHHEKILNEEGENK